MMFRALIWRVWSFSSGLYRNEFSKNKKSISSNTCNAVKKIVHIRFFATLCCFIFLLAITSIAESNISKNRKLDTLHVVPGNVSGDLWHNKNAFLVQDVDENGIYQNFSKDNSAYVTGDVYNIQNTTSNEEVDHSSENLEGDTVLPDESSNTENSEVDPDAPAENTTEPSTDTPAEETALESLSRGFFKFTRIARTMLPFAQESVTIPITENTNEDSDHTVEDIETQTSSEILPLDSTDDLPEENVLQEPPDASQATDEGTVTNDVVDVSDDAFLDVEGEVIIPVLTPESGPELVLTDFALPELESGQFITNVQLRLSLGAQYESDGVTPLPSLTIEYRTDEAWMDAGSIIIDSEVSNAMNGGYFLFALPIIPNISSLEDLEVRLTYRGDTGNLVGIYLDSAWLDIDTETFDQEILKERLIPDDLSYVKLPLLHELISPELDFGRMEDPIFVLRYESQRNAIIRFFRSIFSKTLASVESVKFIRLDGGVLDVNPLVNTTADGLWTIQLSPEDKEKLQPGTYSVRIDIDEGGKMYVDTFDFQWGMIALNPNQTEYRVGDTSTVSLAALSPNGNTICDAHLALYLVDPNQFVSYIPVSASGLCNGNNIIDQADYLAHIPIDTVGTYEMYVEHISETGEVLAHTQDTFTAVATQDLWIERNGPTRIYPPALYPMQITVTTDEPFNGTLIEHVPGNFTVSDTDATVVFVDDLWELSWDLALGASSSATFSYSFDAPDISPYLYTLGPAEIKGADARIIINETLPTTTVEMLAETITTNIDGSDVVLTEPDSISENADVPVLLEEQDIPETVVVDDQVVEQVETVSTSDPIEEPSFIEKIIDTIFGDDEVVPTDNDMQEGDESVIPESVPEPSIFEKIVDTLFGSDEDVPLDGTVPDVSEEFIATENATTSPVTLDSVFTESRKWQIASDATGSMLLYWASTSIPSGWTCVSCQVTDVFYQRFVLGSSTAGTNGGVSSHTHSATGVVTDSAASTAINQTGGGANVPTVGHDHTYTPTISTDSNLPTYRELVLIQYNSAGSPPTLPTNAIAIFDAAVPSGWDTYTAQNGTYIRSLGTTTIGTTGGSNTHSHTISGNLLGTSNFITANAGDNVVNSASAAHTHPVNSFTDTVSHEPPYREAILGKLTATSSPTDAMIAMWTDTPPAGWGTVSSTSEAFVNRFVKPSATYGTTGGAATSTHANTTGINSDPPSGTQTRDLAPNDNTVTTNVHTHTVDVTNYSAVTTLPPYRTAIIAKRGIGGAAPGTTTLHVLFDNEKTGTSTPVFEFTGDDPDGADTLVYQFQWDDDKDLDTSPTGDRTSDNESGCSPNCFSNTASSTDTNPFTDNERMRFTIQTPLSNGTTYYWRVRVKETVGDTWSSWSTIRSVTYESGLDPSAWFQTEGTQFDGGTLSNTGTTTGAVQLSTTSSSVPTVVSGWNVATTTASASLTLTKPLNVEVGDLLIVLVGNDDNSNTAQWDNTTLKPSGFTLINEAGSSAPDTHVAAFYRVADGTEGATTSVTAQSADNYWGFYIRVTGASTTNPINATGADYLDNSGIAIHPITSLNTTATNTLAFYMLAGDAVGTAPFSVAGAGWTESAEITVNTGGTWGTRSMTTAGATGAATVTMSAADGASAFQFAINPSYAQGTIMSPEIDFDSLAGQTDWGALSWSVTEPTGTDTFFRLYYSSTTACDTIVPDSVLARNSTGFDTLESGFIFENLSTTTYNTICLKATLNVGTGTTSPTLTDWTVYWDVPQQSPEPPSLADTPAFPNMKSTTTQPTFGGFSATDYESDRMEFELTIDDDPSFGSPNLTKQSSNYPTDAGWASTTFASGATTTYNVQPADALTNGTTYWWRVRARDPLGTNSWSDYSALRSITISNTITVPEWFETTEYQLSTSSTFTNATTTGAGSAEIVDLDTSISLLSAWSLGTTKATTSGTDRVLIIAIFNEDAETDNINTVTYGGQSVTEIYDHTTGAGGSNSVWVGYLNDAGITSATNTTIVPTWTPGSPVAGDVIYHSAIFGGVDQSDPVRGFSSNALTTGTTISPTASTTVLEGDMAFYIAGVSNVRTFTPDPAYTEGTDNSTCTSNCSSATAYKAITSDGTELPTATLSSSGTRVIMTFVALKPTSAIGRVMSPAVDFDWVSNQSDWGEIIWGVTEPGSSETRLQVYYGTSTDCSTLIPNGTLSGNDVGFTSTATPLNITSISTTTYNRICLRMTLDEGSGSTSPTLNDWTVSWEPQAVLDQSVYHWYANTASATPFDTWPVGTTTSELLENEPINATNPTKTNDVLRLRIGVGVSSVSASNKTFALQYAEGDTCTAELDWMNVGAIGSTTALWRGYNNAGLSDGQTLASSTLDGSDTLETYEEENISSAMPNTVSVGARGEWDWVIQNRATAGTEYCFRMVNADGSTFADYTEYPELVTNIAPSISSVVTPFDNEKLASTSPWFKFVGVDPEADELDYQIQIDNDTDFSSTIIDTDSSTNFDDFLNVDDESDRTPFDDSATIRYIIPSALTDGITYWWRVRTADTNGSATYGDWTTARSFTIDTSVTISTWYQTTEEQFDTDTLEGTDATGSDLVTLISGSTTGTTTSSAMDFDDATTGNAWGQLLWNDTEPPGDILYHMEYYDGSSWALIPDSDLTGNATGFDTSPVSLIDLDTETYNQLRIRANFTSTSSLPTLNNWTVEWGLRVSVPTHLLLFDNEKTGTTTPTFTFYSTDPEDDDLEYEISWSTDNTFVTGSTTVNSSTSPGFANTGGGDTNPFNSGDTISYTISTTTPLTNGSTYWWRLRARDFNGSGGYSFWSDPWSFTVDVTATTSTWFQTTQEQFDTDTLASLVASTSDSVSTVPAGVSTYTFAGVTTPSATHVARYFEVDVLDPTDPPTVDEIDTLTTSGTSAGTPNLNSAIAGYANNAEATNLQYASLTTSDDNSWTTLDPGAGDNAVLWTRFNITEDPTDIDEINILIEARQSGVPGADKGWFGIWRPGSTTPYWQHATSAVQTADATYELNITSNIDDYFDGSNRIHLIYFNEDDSDPVIVDYVEVVITSDTADSGTLTGTSLDFNDGNGPAWGQFRWTDSEPGLSTITYQLQYLTGGGSWALIPDGDLAGNSSGFSTSPVNLSSLDFTTYNEIRPIANFDCVLSSCPTLSDWTITWSPGFTVAGTAFEYDGVSSTTSGTVGVAVNGVLQAGKTGSISNGSWSISNVSFFEDDIITVFVNDATATATDEAVAITEYDGTPDISGMRLQKRHLSIGSDDYATISNSEIELYDFTDNENLFFDVDAGNDLTMCADLGCVDAGIRILPRNTYDPGTGGNVTTHDFVNYGTFTSGSNTIRVSGSWDDNATTTLTSSSIIFTATTSTESIDETGATTTGFNTITLGETSGTATWNLSSAIDVNGNLVVSRGTFGRNTLGVTVAGNLTTEANGLWTGIGTTTFDGVNPSTWTDQNATLQNIGRVVVDGTAKTLLLGSTTTLQSLTIGADDTFDASITGHTVSVYENWINNNTFTARTGKVLFIATTTSRIITAGGDAFYNLNFNGVGGSWSFTEADLSITNDLTIATGTVTMPTGTTTIAGSLSSVGGTFAHNNALTYFTSSGSETISASGTAFTNAFYNLRFTGSGNWSFLDTSATTSNDITITQGTVTFPSNTLTVGGSFTQSGGAFTHNSGTVKFTSASAEVIDINSSSFNSLSFTGTGSWSFADASVTVLDDVTVNAGTLTLPSATLTLGGSITNLATTTHNSGTILFNSTDTGETINLGVSSLYNMTFNGVGGGWTITNHATTTNNFTLGTTSAFTLSSGQTLAVLGTFTNSVGGASTTWTGSTLSLEAGGYSINTKTNAGDGYDTLRVKANTDIQMWNSTSTVYDVDSTGSLYSQDHNGADGDLYIFGNYPRTSGNEYWSYATDFDGTALSTSTSRQVDVRFMSGASASITGSIFEVSGTGTASTTIQNQGSGTYTVSVNVSTTTFGHYDFEDLGSTGVTLSGSGIVTSLADGAYEPGTGGATGLTIASTIIDANPELQIYRVDFSTTTAISATNVTQLDGPPTSFWWFRESVGNIDGEYFDNDTGDPGSIRWDDSSLVVTISGTVYRDDGVSPMSTTTCDDVTPNIRIRVQGGSAYTGSCASADGTFSIPGVVIVGSPVVTVYLNTDGGAQGTVITKTITADVNDLDIYQNRVTTRHEDVTALTILDMSAYDFDDDTDIRYTAATGTLTVFSNTELHIASSTTFAPGGDITIQANASSSSQDGSLHIDDNATFTGSATSTYTLGGSFSMDTGATFTSASTTVVMNATTTGKTITTTASQEITFNNLTFNGLGAGWNINGDVRAIADIAVSTGTVSGTADITVVNGSLSGNGTLSMGSGTTTINSTNTLGGTTAWTFGNLVLGSGILAGTTTPGGATTTILGKLTISTGHFLDGGNTVWNLAGTGNVFVESGTFQEDTTTIRYSGVGATNILSTTYYNLDLKALGGSPTYTGTGLGIIVSNNLTVGGGATTTVTFDTSDPALDVNGNVTIDSTGSLVGSGSASFTVAGSWDNNGSYTGSGGTVIFDGSGTPTISAGVSSFSSVTINGSGTFTISEPATTTSAFTLTSAGSFTVSSGQSLAVGGVFTNSVGGGATTWTGSTLSLYSGTNYSINASTTSDSYNLLSVGTNTDIRMWNSSASTYSIDSSGSLYSQDHAGVNGELYIYGNYPGTGGTDYWSYATDFDGTQLGGSSRKVDVYFASGASALLTSGGLSVMGTGSASTTIQNQGSGTYGFRIAGTASTTWNYYEVRDIDSSGLMFSGSPNVVSLSFGDFEVSQNSGTAITVGGTVITQNPAKTFTNNYFATSTGITPAYNVTATGTTISSWRFTNHTGSIDGEGFNIDPTGDPGYIVWDDSAALITISGTVYADEGVSTSTVCDGSTNNIALRVAGLTSYATSCVFANGTYSIPGVAYSPGDSLVVFIDGNARKAATVSEDPVSNIGNMDLYENRVIVRHESSDALSIADMAVWDSADDPDIPFTAVDAGTDTLTLPADRKLIVWTNKEFEPNGNVTLSGGGAGSSYDGTLELYANALFDAIGSESHSIGGSFISGSGATFDDETSTVTFTTTGTARTIDTNDTSFFNLVLNGSGSWTVTNSALDVGNDFTITQGTVTLPSGTTTISGSLSTTGGSFVTATSSTMAFNSSASETIRPGSSTIGTLNINGAGSFTILGTNATVTADVLVQDGTLTGATGTLAIGGDLIVVDTYTHGSGVLRFIATTTAILTASSSDLYSTTFAGGGAYTFTNTNIALHGSLNIVSGSVALASGTMSVAGSFLNTGGSFNHSSGTILFNSSDAGETINPGSSPFYVVSLASAGGGWTLTGNATATSNFSLTSALNFTLSSSTQLYVGGVFTNLVGGGATTWTGSTLVINSGSSYTINSKLAGGDTYNNVIVGSSTALRAWDSAGTITMNDTASSLYSQDHAGVSGSLYIYGNYARSTGSDYWSYATDFDGSALGGGSRQSFVYIASGATTTFTGGTLNMIGGTATDTVVSNQGSGTYAMDMLGGTLNAQYYSFANMDADGLTLSGTTTITSLAEGNFTLAVSGGSLITLSSTTLNYNTGITVTGVSFATTTAITGVNIEVVGSTPSAWTFTGHTGNLDGEAFDSDGIDDCGSIRWEDSTCLLTQQSAYRFRNDDGGEGVPDSEWFDLDWSKRKRVTITNADATSYTNAAVKLTVAFDSDMQSDFDDLRFTRSDGTTQINHFIESYTASTEAVVWVEVPTLATSTDTLTYMYYGNGVVSDASASTTFNFIDTFEDGGNTEYSGDTGEFIVDGSGAYERTYRLEAFDPNSGKTDLGGMYNNNVTVSQGETLRFLNYIDTTTGASDEICTLFGTQTQTTNYAVCLELFGVDRMSIAQDVLHRDTSGTVLASTTVTYATGWYEVEIDWDTDDSIFVTLSQNGSVVATTSTTDNSYSSGGVGYSLWGYHGGIDVYSSRPLLQSVPTTTFGFEQVSGGATWIGALNTAGSGIGIDENFRVRFLVENSGLPITNQNFEIEYAAKGAAPSCEAVNFNDFVEVPNIASCGTSDICMESSTHFTNLASTTDILGGEGTFTYGQIVEDSSNNTGNISVDADEYTELEYVLTTTLNADDSNYCLRVSNEGTDLDSYAHVAELGLLFAPNVPTASLNGGADIILVGGTTTTVTATGTVTDANGYADLVGATTTIYRSGVGDSCTADNNNCYIAGNSECSFSSCSGDSCVVSCSADIYYFAEPTDTGTYGGETWRATISVIDSDNAIATGSAPSIDLLMLRSIDVDTGIDYGTLEVNADTGSYNATTTIENIGNDALDLLVEGTDLTDGGSSAIPVSEQIFATSTFTYGACVFCSSLSTTTTNIEVDLAKPTSTSTAITDQVFWGISVPFGVAGTAHSGVNTFTATGD